MTGGRGLRSICRATGASTIDVLQTPEAAFDDLPDWSYDCEHVEVDAGTGSVRMAVWTAGRGRPVLLLHGVPSWAYLYRRMIPLLAENGCSVVVPDLIGFGASDKPAEASDHTYATHVAWLTQALHDEMDLRGAVMFCQDWGGLLGLRLIAADPQRYSGVVASNTGLPTGDQEMSEAFTSWQSFAAKADPFPISMILQGGSTTELLDEELAAYEAPFPSEAHKAGPRALPGLVPTSPDDPEAEAQREAWGVLKELEVPLLTAFSDGDPVTAGGDRVFRKLVPSAQDRPHTTIEGAGHFLQEDRPSQCVRAIMTLRRR